MGGAVLWMWLCVATAKKKTNNWTNRRVLVLYRGVHAGAYKGRGRFVYVDGNTDKVHTNHRTKLIEPLVAAGANVTIAACTYKSKVLKDWLVRSDVARANVLDARVDGRARFPNELILEAYDFVLKLKGWHTLVSVRADIIFKRQFTDVSSDLERLGVPWKEVHNKMPRDCTFRKSGFEPSRCDPSWKKNGERYADAMVVAPARMVPDLRFAVAEAIKLRVVWDQHSTFQHLKKQRGYTHHDNVSTMIDGYWNSNPNVHENPLFALARKKRVAHRGGGGGGGGGHS